MVDSSPLDPKALSRELRRRIRGEVRFDAGSRALYSTDASNYRQVPIGVVIPRDTEDVVTAVEVCRAHGAPVLSRGGGTSLAGQCCNVAVVLDLSKYLRRIVALDPAARRATVEPGAVLDHLRAAAEHYHLTFAPDPTTHPHCTLGGMIGNNSCGVHSLMGGKTVDNVEELEVLTYDGLRLRVGETSEDRLAEIIRAGGRQGTIYRQLKALRDRYADLIRSRYPKIPRRVSGYNLDQLLPENGFHVARALVGTEGTCVTVLSAVVRLVESPPARALAVLGYPNVYTAAAEIQEILAYGPLGLEGFDHQVIAAMAEQRLHSPDLRLLPDGTAWLLAELGGSTGEEAIERAQKLVQALGRRTSPPAWKLIADPTEASKVWAIRESALAATSRAFRGREAWAGWEDAAVPPARLSDYLRDFHRLLERYGYSGALYGHFGEACVHVRIDFDLKTKEGIAKFRSFLYDAADLVVRYGGSLSGEHGDGQARGELLSRMFGEELVQAFREFKAIWDPAGKMNPGKVVDAWRADENLRLGASYQAWSGKTIFGFPEDGGSFAQATLRCVGVGKCRRTGGGTMCPSYMVTLEEEHSTRGRARMLFEMLQGEVLKGGWRDPFVKEALNLCLACKACKSECPAGVDMATYKAEFLSHYYAGRLRPASAYTMGLIHTWARLAARVPRLANFFTRAPVLCQLAKAAAGMAPARRFPSLAAQSLRSWFANRKQPPAGKPSVILWPDTFTSFFQPQIGIAAVEVLEAAGYAVKIPAQDLCCGRPLYDYGMLGQARRRLRRVLDVLAPEIGLGTPVVCLEPSCLAVFRDELLSLFPYDELARRLSHQAMMFSEFLVQVGYQPPRLERDALVHAHCHHQAVIGFGAEDQLLSLLGLRYQVLKAGCCGMAGGFGFEKEHYAVSLQIGERVLLPAVRNAAAQSLIIADGFSCREQIAQATGRRAMHVAEVIRMALDNQPGP